MEQDREVSFPQFVKEAIQSLRVIGMTMTQYNGLNAPKIHTKQRQVVQCPIGCHSGIKQDRFPLPLVESGDQQGDTMLCTQLMR